MTTKEEGVISKRQVRARRSRTCSDCRGGIEPRDTYWRLYGSCHPHLCPPYVVVLCEKCEAEPMAERGEQRKS